MADGRLSTDDLVLRPGDPDPRTAPHDGSPRELPLLDEAQSEQFLQRWDEVQTRFVDDPRAALRDGDALVAELLQALAARFAEHKDGIESRWLGGGEPTTEDLRQALQSYRSFFQRLLAT